MTLKRKVWLGVAIVVAGLLFLPYKSLNAPDWSILVVDSNNQPVSGVLVRESYQNYSAESEGHEEDQTTDANGRVTFHRKTLHATGIKRILGTLSSATAGVHASFGSSAYVNAFGGNGSGEVIESGHVYFWNGKPDSLSSTITLHVQ